MGGLCSTPNRGDERISSSPLFTSKWTYKGVTFENGMGDICYLEVDAIVNASNGQLVHNNGLSNSMIAQGGDVIQEESNKIIEDNNGALHVGTAVATSGGALTAKYIIHVVTPIWTGGDNNEAFRLEKCIINALLRAEELEIRSIAFPSLTSGVFGFPRDKCAEIIINKCLEYLEENIKDTTLREIKFINMDVNSVKAFKHQMDKLITQKFVLEQESGLLQNTISDDSLVQPSQIRLATKEEQKIHEENIEEETSPTVETRQTDKLNEAD